MGLSNVILHPLMAEALGGVFDKKTGTRNVIDLCNSSDDEDNFTTPPTKKKPKRSDKHLWKNYEIHDEYLGLRNKPAPASTSSDDQEFDPNNENTRRMRSWILTQREVEDMTQDKMPAEEEDGKMPAVEDDRKMPAKPADELVLYKADNCCAREDCKRKGEAVPNSLQCPCCSGYVHYQCANFNVQHWVGLPLCVRCENK